MEQPAEVSLESDSLATGIPDVGQFSAWVAAALAMPEAGSAWRARALPGARPAIHLQVVDEADSRTLNERYRGKDRPTNVLSFPAELEDEVRLDLVGETGVEPLGDLVLCAPVVIREASEQGKPESSHWAHLTIHGTLHLLGFDHEQEADALRMEKLETAILTSLGISDPYA